MENYLRTVALQARFRFFFLFGFLIYRYAGGVTTVLGSVELACLRRFLSTRLL